MKHRVLAQVSLLVLLAMAQYSCQPASETPDVIPLTEEPPIPQPFEEQPAFQLTPLDKPSLLLTDPQGVLTGLGISPLHAIGFVFPDGLVAMKGTAVNNPYAGADNLVVVGVVEIGSEAAAIAPGSYLVAIDLASQETIVNGKVQSVETDEERGVTFERTALVRNPAREDSPSFPTVNPIISSTAVCFVVGLSDSGEVPQAAERAVTWSRYCSLAATDTGESILSVQANFPVQYETLIGRWGESIERLNSQGFQLDVNLDLDLTISEMEGHSNLVACNEKNDCASDITGAPNASFWEEYFQAKDAAGGNNFVVTAAIVRVERLLEVPGQQPVQPGDYWVRDWFDAEDNFLGATILGVTVDNVPVLGQTIPAVPSYFLDADNPQKILSWISAWKLCNWCKWQSNCP